MGCCLSSPVASDDQPLTLVSARPVYQRANDALPCPIATVPFDVLLMLFREFCANTARERYLKHARTLASVCFTWRGLVLRERGLWQNVYVRGARVLHDLQCALPRSGAIPLEVGIDCSEVRGAHPIPECGAEAFYGIVHLLNSNMARVTKLTIVLPVDALLSFTHLSAPAPELRELSLSVYGGMDVARLDLFSGVSPRLANVSVEGIHISRWHPAMLCALQVLRVPGEYMDYEDLLRILSVCRPTLRELHIKNCCIRDARGILATGPRNATAALATPSLAVVSLTGVNALTFHTADLSTTALVLSTFELHRVKTIDLVGSFWSHVQAAAEACFRGLSALNSLELSREPIATDWQSALVRAVTESGLTRTIECSLFPSAHRPDLFTVTRLLAPDAQTVRSLVVPLDWVVEFAQRTTLSLGQLESLTLTYNRRVFFPARQEATGPRWTCPFLQTVVLDVTHRNIVPEVLSSMCTTMARMIEFDQSQATLVLRGAVSKDAVLDSGLHLFRDIVKR